MLGFTPLAATPLSSATVGDIDFSTINFQVDDVVGSAPVIDIVSIFEEETVPIADITLGAPTIGAVTALYTDVLAADEITLGAPIVDTAPVFERETCDVDDVTLGAPSIEAAPVAVISNFFPQDVAAGEVAIDTLPFFQEHLLAADDITSGAPTFAVRFTWDFQELQSDSWREDHPEAFPIDLEFPPNSALRIALASASVGVQPEEDLFVNTIVGGRSLGSVYDGAVGAVNGVSDALEMQRYIEGSSFTSQASIDYIENFMLPYMAANPDLYSEYYTGNATSSRIPNWDEQEESSSTWSEQVSFPESNNNYGWTIVEAITLAATNFEPEATLFVDAEATQGRPLGDINNSGVVTYLDALDMASYIRGALSDQNKIDYIENYMLPYMAARPDDYKIYYNATTESSSPSWTAASESVKVWTNAA